MPQIKRDRFEQALVIGGSLAGLLAARVLSDYFEQVTIIERDAFPNGPEHRNGVPQARHQHVLLLKGKALIEIYFPGFEQQLLSLEAVPADVGSELLTVSIFGRIAPFQTDTKMLFCSRDLIEWCVRNRLSQHPNIHLLSRAEATGLLKTDDNRRVVGVQLRGRGDETVPETLAGDLVVDCSGRGSEAIEWLAGMGYPRPETTVVNSHLGYSTRWYKRRERAQPWKGALVAVRPPHNPRGGGLLPAEGGRWVVTLAGTAGLYPPTDEAGFLEFARQLADPAIYEVIREAEPLSPVYGYRRTENQWRHYERMRNWPAGFAVMGDAACCFNPLYGQGMTVAALSAGALDQMLGSEPGTFEPGFGRAFQRKLAGQLKVPWLMATNEDFRWENTEGERPGPATRLVQKYFDRVLRLSVNDARASQAFMDVVHLVQSPAMLFRPGILLPALLRRTSDHN